VHSLIVFGISIPLFHYYLAKQVILNSYWNHSLPINSMLSFLLISAMIRLENYNTNYKDRWDQFISNSKNGLFLFHRDYMEYHSDKFEDFSLMFFKGKKLVAVMPANIKNGMVSSHDGLTFGGIVSDKNMKTEMMLNIFDVLKEFLKDNGVKKLLYKAIPHIYHTIPAEEDLYALFRNNVKLIRRDVTSAISTGEKIAYSRNKKRKMKASEKSGLKIQESRDFGNFMAIEEKRLREKYGVTPTHTAEQINMLAKRFPNNIKLFTAEINNEIHGGVIIFESKNVAHGQYQSATVAGLKLGGTDLIFEFLINNYYKDKKYFDFGISTEKNGLYLNEGLINYKEQFGARAVVHDFYQLEI
jgi:hypothetical protein